MRALLITSVLFCGAATAAAGDWSGFRGDDGRSHASSGEYPIHWSPAKNVPWKAELPGFGQSAPVVRNGVVYVLAVEGPNKERNHVLALDACTGEKAWQQSFDSSAPAKNTPMVGRAAPTPAADDSGVYAFFESGDLAAISTEGDVRWQRSLTTEYGPFTNRHGLGSSLAQTDDAVIVLVDQQADGYLLAVSKSNGETLWKTDRPNRNGWSSPTVATLCGVLQVVVSAGGAVDGYHAATGELLWSCTGLTGNSIPSPTIVGDRIFVGARMGRQGGDLPTVSRSNRCIRVRPEGDSFIAETVWEAEKVVSHYASPLVVGESVYYTNNIGVLFRLNAETGEPLDRLRGGRPCWTTPIAAGNRIYLFGDDGTTTVFDADDSLTEIATNQLWTSQDAPGGDPYAASNAESPSSEASSTDSSSTRSPSADAEYDRPTVYGAAAADGAFYVRSGTQLYCIRQK